jgi:hypothetical protein
MQFLLLFSLTSFLSLFNLDGWRGDIQQPQAQQEVLCVGVKAPIKAFLEGPFINTAASVLMSDNLRTNNGAAANGSQSLIPATEPYSSLTGFTHVGGGGGEIIPAVNVATVFGVTGNNAIVDWVFVELRDPLNAATVLATRSALIQVDGDVVDVDGTSPVTFATTNCGNFFVAIRHRNHFGIRTNLVVALTNDAATTAVVDFTTAAPVHGVFGTATARKTLTTSGALTMYAGDANRDGNVDAADRNLGWRVQTGNAIGGGTFTYLTLTSDFNLSGDVNAADRNLYWRINTGLSQQL